MEMKSKKDIKILIVVDSRTMGIILMDLLTAIGFSRANFTQTGDPREALERLETDRADLIISNLWVSPSMNGIELLESVRIHPRDDVRDTPFFIITGDRNEEHAKLAREKGVNGFLMKPFQAKKLQQLVDDIFTFAEQGSDFGSGSEGVSPSDAFLDSSQDLAGMNILLVDDSRANRAVLSSALKGQGFGLTEAEDREMALKLLFASLPDLIILDVVMQGMNGFETCRKIKAEEATRDIPIIFITAQTEMDQLVEGFLAGGADYIAKPFQKEEVLLRVRKQLQLQKVIKDKEILIHDLLDLKEKHQILISDLMAAKENLEKMAVTDSLTELPNRRGLWDFLESERKRFVRNQKPFCILLGDIDHFKKVNDTHGHDAGDFVLVEIGKLFLETLRQQDSPGRWGGEEFLAVFPETDRKGGMAVAEKLRMAIEGKDLVHEGVTIPITMSFGLWGHDSMDHDLDQCVQKADEFLYHAKETGRNKVVDAF